MCFVNFGQCDVKNSTFYTIIKIFLQAYSKMVRSFRYLLFRIFEDWFLQFSLQILSHTLKDKPPHKSMFNFFNWSTLVG